MEELTVKALVVKSVDYGDFDKLLTLVTEDKGKLTVTVKGGKSLRSKFVSVSEPFTYAAFNLRKSNKYFYVYDSDLLEDFYLLRDSIEKLSLAAYICDVTSELSLEGISDPEILQLSLNTLYALAYKDGYDIRQIKGAFEFKAAVIAGFMPDLSGCELCSEYNGETMYLDVRGGRLLCESCLTLGSEITGLDQSSVIVPVTLPVIMAFVYIATSRIQKLLSFRLDMGEMPLFASAAEKYLINHLEKDFYTLNFYKSLL